MDIKQPIGQTIVKRKYIRKNVADPLMYTEYYDDVPESDEEFIGRVTAEANTHYECVLNISYLDRDTAVIIWKDVSYNKIEEDPSINYKEIKVIRTPTQCLQQYEYFVNEVYKLAGLFPNSKVTFHGDEAIIKYEV